MLARALFPALLASGPAPVDPALAERFARLALACVHQEYPNKSAHVMSSDADARPPLLGGAILQGRLKSRGQS